MKLDLKDPAQFTLEGVKALIASKDDSQNRQLRVTKDGIAFLSDVVGLQDIDNLAFRLETWGLGNNYVGIAASNNEKWVQRVYDCLKKNWPAVQSGFLIDIF